MNLLRITRALLLLIQYSHLKHFLSRDEVTTTVRTKRSRHFEIESFKKITLSRIVLHGYIFMLMFCYTIFHSDFPLLHPRN